MFCLSRDARLEKIGTWFENKTSFIDAIKHPTDFYELLFEEIAEGLSTTYWVQRINEKNELRLFIVFQIILAKNFRCLANLSRFRAIRISLESYINKGKQESPIIKSLKFNGLLTIFC
jgi:hypothetical protein